MNQVCAVAETGGIRSICNWRNLFPLLTGCCSQISRDGRRLTKLAAQAFALEGKNINDQIRLAVEKHKMTADQNVCAIGWRRGQSALQFDRHWIEVLLQTRRKRTVADQLFLKTRRQPVFLGQLRREVFSLVAVPATNNFVVIRISRVVIAALVLVFIMTLSMALALGQGSRSA